MSSSIRIWQRPTTTDANDFLWQWSSSADYDASGDLEKIQATVLAINSIDDEVNPPETGLMTRAMKRLKNGRLFLILTSDETSGHLTTGQAKFYKQVLQRLLDAVPAKDNGESRESRLMSLPAFSAN